MKTKITMTVLLQQEDEKVSYPATKEIYQAEECVTLLSATSSDLWDKLYDMSGRLNHRAKINFEPFSFKALSGEEL